MSRRFQFSLFRSLEMLFWLMLCVACFLGGMIVQRHLDKPNAVLVRVPSAEGRGEEIILGDGTSWHRMPSDK
jgi:hypothetical protein